MPAIRLSILGPLARTSSGSLSFQRPSRSRSARMIVGFVPGPPRRVIFDGHHLEGGHAHDHGLAPVGNGRVEPTEQPGVHDLDARTADGMDVALAARGLADLEGGDGRIGPARPCSRPRTAGPPPPVVLTRTTPAGR